MGRALAVPLPVGGTAAPVAGVEEAALVTLASHVVKFLAYRRGRAGPVGGAMGGDRARGPRGVGPPPSNALSGPGNNSSGRGPSASKGVMGAVVRKMIQPSAVRAWPPSRFFAARR